MFRPSEKIPISVAHKMAMATASTSNIGGITLDGLKKQKPSTPYNKSIKVKIIDAKPWMVYENRKNNKTSSCMKFTAADSTDHVRAVAYDEKAHKALLKEDASLLIRNYIFQQGSLRLTSNTKIYRCEDIGVPQSIREESFSPPMSKVTQIHSSPVKSLVGLEGTITKEEAVKTVKTNDINQQVKEITVSDETGHVRVSLWNAMSSSPVKCGDKVSIKDATVKFSSYYNENTLSINTLSQVQVLPKEQKVEPGIILAISAESENTDHVNLYVQTTVERDMICNTEILCSYLSVDLPTKIEDLEDLITPFLPIKCQVKIEGGEIIQII